MQVRELLVVKIPSMKKISFTIRSIIVRWNILTGNYLIRFLINFEIESSLTEKFFKISLQKKKKVVYYLKI